MHKIHIIDFGPIKNAELEIVNMVFVLGEQSSGKSTIAKTIYYFQTFHDEFVELVFSNKETEWKQFRKRYISLLKSKFTNIFGSTHLYDNFKIEYFFTDDYFVNITPSQGNSFLSITLSKKLNKELASIWDKISEFLSFSQDNAYKMYTSIVNEGALNKDILSKLRLIFSNETQVKFIPAGRAYLTNNALLQIIQSYEIRAHSGQNGYVYSPYDVIDAIVREYNDEINRIRMWESKSKSYEDLEKKDREFIRYLDDIRVQVLRGIYLPERNYDYIKLDDGKKIPLSYASSGQREVVWILNMLFSYVFDRKKCLILIEEPEAHLYPDTQYLLTKYITAFRNFTGSHVLITTHSPYILSSFNNLVFAAKHGKKNRIAAQINDIIPQTSWICPDEFSAYIINDGILESIKDEELAMIDPSILDAVASKQFSEYESILALSREA